MYPRFPFDVSTEILLFAPVIKLLELRQSGQFEVLYDEKFWERYCRGRGWGNISISYPRFRILTGLFENFDRPSLSLSQEDSHEMYMEKKIYTWEMSAIVNDIQRDADTVEYRNVMPPPCYLELQDALDRIHKKWRSSVYASTPFFLCVSPWNEPSTVQHIGRGIRVRSHSKPRFGHELVDVEASRKELRKMYVDADKVKKQNRSGWERRRK